MTIERLTTHDPKNERLTPRHIPRSDGHDSSVLDGASTVQQCFKEKIPNVLIIFTRWTSRALLRRFLLL
jgi:hypothetical protein